MPIQNNKFYDSKMVLSLSICARQVTRDTLSRIDVDLQHACLQLTDTKHTPNISSGVPRDVRLLCRAEKDVLCSAS